MRVNKLVAYRTGLSRRKVDELIQLGRIKINGSLAAVGQAVDTQDTVTIDEQNIATEPQTVTILLHKPVGYVCSKRGQGNHTIYELLPKHLHTLNPVGRLDKDSSGLLLLTNDGALAHRLTHPSFMKQKTYVVHLDSQLSYNHELLIQANGVALEDGTSKLGLRKLDKQRQIWEVTMHEGRNRQIRRTFGALGYKVLLLRRETFGPYKLGRLSEGHYEVIQG